MASHTLVIACSGVYLFSKVLISTIRYLPVSDSQRSYDTLTLLIANSEHAVF